MLLLTLALPWLKVLTLPFSWPERLLLLLSQTGVKKKKLQESARLSRFPRLSNSRLTRISRLEPREMVAEVFEFIK